MNIQQLLASHELHPSQQTLKNSLGDAYLYQFNPIFRNIRQLAILLKTTFQSPPDSDYQTLPYTQLEKILKAQNIPYYDNVSVLKNLPQSLDWSSIQDSLRKNFVFHESCHVIARDKTKSLIQSADTHEKIFLRLLEESFANTLELLSIIYVKDSTHRNFYEVNSFTSLFEHQNYFKKASVEIGTFELFHMVLMGYVYSNFLRASLDESDFKLIMNLTFEKRMRTVHDKALKSILKLTFQLDLDFRIHITPLHLQLSGHKVSVAELKKIPIQELLVNHQEIIKAMIHEALRNS